MKLRMILATVLGIYIIFLLDLAWFRFPATHPAPNWVPFRSIIRDWRNGGWEFAGQFRRQSCGFSADGAIPTAHSGEADSALASGPLQPVDQPRDRGGPVYFRPARTRC